MTKVEFLSLFRAACENLPVELVEASIADLERDFTDRLLAGQSEADIVQSWGAPQNAALKLKVGTFNGNLKKAVSAQKVARVGVSGVGLVCLDLLLLFPAFLYSVLLSAFYLVALLTYLSGIVFTSASLAGVQYVDIPAQVFPMQMAIHGHTRLDIGELELLTSDAGTETDGSTPLSVPGAKTSIHVATHISDHSYWHGLAAVLSGMIGLTLCFMLTGLTFRILRQFVAWHGSVLKNA